MSISYSGIIGYGKANLPSVESWGQNTNIIRDPPKSITTRRKDRVGDTNAMTEILADSEDRFSEGISYYARGINPSVSVDYGNVGNNGGQRSGFGGKTSDSYGGSGNSLYGGQAFLPHRIMKDGDFRFPIQKPHDLLPLSRMPRKQTETVSKKGFVDFSKKLMCPGGNYREIKENLNVSVRPTATYKMNIQVSEPFEVKYVIKNPVKFDRQAGVTGMRTRDITSQDVIKPTKQINNTPLYMEDIYANKSGVVRYEDNSHMNTKRYLQDPLNTENVYANKSGGVRYEDNSHMNTERYLQDPLHSSVNTQMSRSIQVTPIEDIFDIDIHTKDSMNISYTPLKTGYTKDESMHKELDLKRRVIGTDASTNHNSNIYVHQEIDHQPIQKLNRPNIEVLTNYDTKGPKNIVDLNNREYNLKETLNYGGMTGRGQMPLKQVNSNSDVNLRESIQHSRNRKVLDMQLGRH
jgi:hypothetical protein